MKTVLIFGGSGYLGKHIIRRVAKNGYKIIIPHQKQVNEAKLRLLGRAGQIIPIRFRSINEEKIKILINKADIIINLKTLWDEKKITFKKGIINFNVELISNIKKTKKNTKFIFFSGIGIDEQNDSLRSNAIYQIEKYILKNLNNSVIVRPGIVIGGGDNFLKRLLPMFKISFFIPLFGDGSSEFQPVFVDDVSIAINKLINLDSSENLLYEFVGPDIFTYKEIYSYLSNCLDKTRVLVPIPFNIIKILVKIIEKTPFSPINSEQLKLFEKDNIASNKYKNLGSLGVRAQGLKEIIKNIIKKEQ